MTRVRMLKLAAGPGGVLADGSVQDLDAGFAEALIEAGAAEPFGRAQDEPPPDEGSDGEAGEGGEAKAKDSTAGEETATAAAPETAAEPQRRNPSKSRRRRS